MQWTTGLNAMLFRNQELAENVAKTDIGIDVKKLNDQFVSSKILTAISNQYDDLCYPPEHTFSFRCVNQFQLFKCFSQIKSNAVGSDGLDPLFVKALAPKLLPIHAYIHN